MRALFVPFSVGGHLNATLALVEGFRSRGHTICVLGHEELRSRVEAAGAEFLPPRDPDRYGYAILHHEEAEPSKSLRGLMALAERVEPYARLGFLLNRYWELRFARRLAEMVEATAREVARAAERMRPDVVIGDVFSLGARYGAVMSGRPYASYATDPSQVLDPAGKPYWLPNALLLRLPRRVFDVAFSVRSARRALNIAPQAFSAEVFATSISPDLHLVLAPSAFSGATPSTHRFIGPPKYDPAAADVDMDAVRAMKSGAVLVTGSTTGFASTANVLRKTVEAFAQTSLDVVVAAGPLNGWRPNVPKNVTVLDGYAPHDVMIPHASVVCTHGGWGLVGRALRAGVPTIVTPAFGPQHFVAERIQALSLGLRVPFDEVSPARMLAAHATATQDRKISSAVATLRARLARVDTESLAVAEVERLVNVRQQTPQVASP